MDLGEARVLARSLVQRLEDFPPAMVSPADRDAIKRLILCVEELEGEAARHQNTLLRLQDTNQMLADTGDQLEQVAAAYDELRAAANEALPRGMSVQVDPRRARGRAANTGPDLAAEALTEQLDQARHESLWFDHDPATCPYCGSAEHLLCEEGKEFLKPCAAHEMYHIRCRLCWMVLQGDIPSQREEE